MREISSKIKAAKYRDKLRLHTALAARADDLIQELNERSPHVLHFSGHGTSMGQLVFTNEQNESHAVTGQALTSLFATLRGNIQLVVLNACFSELQANAILEQVDCVIGMKDTIADDAARIFGAALYRAIAFGKSIQQAFEQAAAALELEGTDQENVPVLMLRDGVDASEVYLVNEGYHSP